MSRFPTGRDDMAAQTSRRSLADGRQEGISKAPSSTAAWAEAYVSHADGGRGLAGRVVAKSEMGSWRCSTTCLVAPVVLVDGDD